MVDLNHAFSSAGAKISQNDPFSEAFNSNLSGIAQTLKKDEPKKDAFSFVQDELKNKSHAINNVSSG